MNNDRDPRNRLLAETLHGEWSEGPAAAMARRAAAAVRRRRRLRAAAATISAAAIVVATFVAYRRPPISASTAADLSAIVATNAALTAPAAVVTSPAAKSVGYEIISDDELIALLHDRPLLVLPQENGPKKIVLLDR